MLSTAVSAYERKDAAYRRAKQEGYRSRAAYKLEELDRRFKLLARGARVVDLGCWPGAWLQVAARRVGPTGRVVGIDVKSAEPIAADHVAIVIHNYRWRQGLAEGEAKYDTLEKRLAESPIISVPTITMEGDANGAPHPEPAAYARMFSGKYAHRLITGGTGHNLPQEAPHTPSPRRSST